MKQIFIFSFLLILFFPLISFSQCYTVLAVKGEIISEKTGQPIKEMDEICATDKLTFSSQNSKASVFSSEQGTFVIKLGDKKKKDALTAFVGSVLFSGKEKLSTKNIDFDELDLININFYEKEFGNEYFVIRESKILVDSKLYPMDENNFFYVKYLFDGNEIEKKLKFDKDTLLIDKDIYKTEEFDINPEKIDSVSLYYFDKGKNNHLRLTSFSLAFADDNILKSELSNYITILKKYNLNDYLITEQVINFIYDMYGNVNWHDIRSYLAEKFSIK